MIDPELFELCKEVYKRFPDWSTGNWIDYNEGKFTVYGVSDNRYGGYVCPLFNSDYLLEVLPAHTSVKSFLVNKKNGARFMAEHCIDGRFRNFVADTPLKALLKLTTALHEAGELTA